MKSSCRILIMLSLMACSVPGTSAFADDTASITNDVIYGHKDGLALTFDVHRPANPNGAAVIFINSGGHKSPSYDLGGAYSQSDLDKFESHKPLLEAGFVIFDLRHGSNPRFSIPEIASDVHQGVRFIRRHAKDFGVDPERLGVWGHSAGGHLALLTGLNPGAATAGPSEAIESDRVSAIVALAPLTDLARLMAPYPTEGRSGPPGMDFGTERFPEFSPLFFASSDDPPTLLIHGDEDNLVPISQSQLMRSALEDASVDVDLLVISGAGHGLWARDEIAPATVKWFQMYLLRH